MAEYESAIKTAIKYQRRSENLLVFHKHSQSIAYSDTPMHRTINLT